ncbi:MAG: hypothetical protein WD377_02255 [Nitriliruptoraceae bacterium]
MDEANSGVRVDEDSAVDGRRGTATLSTGPVVDGPTCASCGGANAPTRELCRHCGADLAPAGETSAVVTPVEVDDRPSVPAARSPSFVSVWWLPIVGGAAAIFIVLVGLALFDVGPFAPTRDLAPAELDEALYGEERLTIAVSDVATATTAPPQGGQIYTASHIVDLDPTTAWRSRPLDPEGPHELIDLFLARPAWVELLMFHNGEHVDADAYAASGRVQRALVTFDGGDAFIINLLDQGRVAQAVELPRPVLTTTIRVEILETFPGATHGGVAVSDVELFGRMAMGDDVTEAEERAAVLRAAGR